MKRKPFKNNEEVFFSNDNWENEPEYQPVPSDEE